MKLYDKVRLKEDFGDYKKGALGIIVEIFDDKDTYLEMLDSEGDTLEVLYCVPMTILENVSEKDKEPVMMN